MIKGVDNRRTNSNHLREIYEVLGVEACRNAIIKEAEGVLEEQGLDVDIRHIMLVADIMTSTGDLRQIGRHVHGYRFIAPLEIVEMYMASTRR